jgi:hypothetical protein
MLNWGRGFRPESIEPVIRAVGDNVDIDRPRCIRQGTSHRFPVLKESEK